MKNAAAIQKSYSRFCSRVLVGVGLVAFISCMALAQKPGSGLELNLFQESDMQFRAELRNTGVQAVVLNLGTMLGNGREQYADRIHLLLTGPHGGQFHLAMRSPAIINGRVDTMVVPLPPGATFTLPIDLRNYNESQDKVWELSLAPGQYTLTAEYTGAGVAQAGANLDLKGIRLMPFRGGNISSAELHFALRRKWNATR